ncbi:hypothetical protein ACLOJK_040643 [Asimina triloba]
MAAGEIFFHDGSRRRSKVATSDERRMSALPFSIFSDGRSEIPKTHLVGRQRHGVAAARRGNGRQQASSSNFHEWVTGAQRLASQDGSTAAPPVFSPVSNNGMTAAADGGRAREAMTAAGTGSEQQRRSSLPGVASSRLQRQRRWTATCGAWAAAAPSHSAPPSHGNPIAI